MRPLETKIFGSFTVEIHVDDNSQDPREWGQGDELDPAILEQWRRGAGGGHRFNLATIHRAATQTSRS